MLVLLNTIILLFSLIFLSIWSQDFSIMHSMSILDYLISVNSKFTVDFLSVSCMGMLITCFIIAGVFYWHYFSWHSDYLIINIQGFVSSMVFLILSSSVLISFIGWELLGISSFFLILYYSTYYSSRAAIITVVSSRLGDVGFFLFIALVINDNLLYLNSLGSIFIAFLIISKSAVFPLTSWLLEAMRAPTPVSSLVHSSTLVAAGVVLISRYESMLANNSYSYFFFLLCIVTVILSASSAFFYSDTKKIIALSTCNNISWCYIYLYSGMMELCILQLVCHGIFKCMLFCLIGDFLVNSHNSQNKSMHFYISSYSYSIILNVICLFISGAPFIGVYFSKHLFISYLSDAGSLPLLILSIMGMSLSFLYTFRLLNIVNSNANSSTNGFNNIFYLCILLVPYSLLLNSSLSNCLLEDNLPTLLICLLVNSLIAVSSILGYILCFNSVSKWNNSLYGQDFFVIDSSYILGSISSIIYSFSIFRWEAFIINVLLSYRSVVSLGFMLLLTFMFYLLIVL
uniref:NADH:ubiquinone reductase (H(+)-translocating) n=1 Tax=Gyrodactylus sp. FY-2015 TaxID=1678844 RepID=A0A7R5WR41_9PLAT|nr:NADH dehydrogenase subunit 5 [Gyrodactylus sp. FY-2015]